MVLLEREGVVTGLGPSFAAHDLTTFESEHNVARRSPEVLADGDAVVRGDRDLHSRVAILPFQRLHRRLPGPWPHCVLEALCLRIRESAAARIAVQNEGLVPYGYLPPSSLARTITLDSDSASGESGVRPCPYRAAAAVDEMRITAPRVRLSLLRYRPTPSAHAIQRLTDRADIVARSVAP
jgi:hypothetical protein